MSWLITIIVGLIIGILGGLVSRSLRKAGYFSNILSGIAGAIIGYWLYVSVFGLGVNTTDITFFSGAALLWEAVASAVWLGVMSMVRAGETVQEERMAEERTAQERKPQYGYEYYEEEEGKPKMRREHRDSGYEEETEETKRKRYKNM